LFKFTLISLSQSTLYITYKKVEIFYKTGDCFIPLTLELA